jgi:hypothetical protein
VVVQQTQSSDRKVCALCVERSTPSPATRNCRSGYPVSATPGPALGSVRCGSRTHAPVDGTLQNVAETAGGASEDADAVPDGVSAFIAKVLNQLSLSAWLPAAVFAASVTMLAQFRSQKSLSVGHALKAITDHPGPILILILPVLVLTTMLTQAFSFGAIRALEGYWMRRGPMAWSRSLMIRRHAGRRDRLEKRRAKLAKKAFDRVRTAYLGEYSFAIVAALELQAVEQDVPELPEEDQATYDTLTWRDLCKPWDLAKVDQMDLQLKDYPELETRTMPTKLGNLLRRTEDSLQNAGDDVQGFAMRRRGLVSARVQTQHDQFRDRLDMYCTLVFVSAVLVVVCIAALWDRVRWWQTTSIALGFALFAIVCYGSAIASARGYCVALRQMDTS